MAPRRFYALLLSFGLLLAFCEEPVSAGAGSNLRGDVAWSGRGRVLEQLVSKDRWRLGVVGLSAQPQRRNPPATISDPLIEAAVVAAHAKLRDASASIGRLLPAARKVRGEHVGSDLAARLLHGAAEDCEEQMSDAADNLELARGLLAEGLVQPRNPNFRQSAASLLLTSALHQLTSAHVLATHCKDALREMGAHTVAVEGIARLHAAVEEADPAPILLSLLRRVDDLLRQQPESSEEHEQQQVPHRVLDDEDSDSDDEDGDGGSSSGAITRPTIPTPAGFMAHVVVDQRGRGNYTSIKAAVDDAPNGKEGSPYVIYIHAGVYKEKVEIKKAYVTVVGDGADHTIVTGSDSVAGGSTTFKSATFAATKQGFTAIGIRFQNTAQESQAVALRIGGDMAIIRNCDIYGFQDSLYAHNGRQYYYKCRIRGTVDFIFGKAAAVFDQCEALLLQRPNGLEAVVMASGRDDPAMPTGLVFVNGQIKGNGPPSARYGFLGRPWKPYSREVYIDNHMTQVIHPEGWMTWGGSNWDNHPYYAEWNSKGPGANPHGRASFATPGTRVQRAEATAFLPQSLLHLASWLGAPPLVVPVLPFAKAV